MTERRFSYLVSGFDYETQGRIDVEIARARVYDYDLEYIDWQHQFDMIIADVYGRDEADRIAVRKANVASRIETICSAIVG